MTSTTVAVYRLIDGTPQRFLGWASLISTHLVVLHPKAASRVHRLRAEQQIGSDPLRVRCQITNGSIRHARDGDLIFPGEQPAPLFLVSPVPGDPPIPVDGPVAVAIQPRSTAPISAVGWPLHGGSDQVLDRLEAFLAAAAAHDPVGPPASGPMRPPRARGVPYVPGLKPPWCAIWPTAIGCRAAVTGQL